MGAKPEPHEVAKRLLDAEEALQRSMRACEELEQSSRQLTEAAENLNQVTKATRELLTATAALSRDALQAVQAVKSLNPAELFARIEGVTEVARAEGRSVLRAVWLAAAVMAVILLGAFLVLHK